MNKNNASLKTVDIPVDGTIKWSDIKKDKSLKFKTIDDEDQIEKLIADGISNHLNQAEGTPLTIEPFASLIGTDSYTSFSEQLLEGTADVSKLKVSSTVAKYLKSLKRNKEIIATEKENVIPLKEFKSGFKNWK